MRSRASFRRTSLAGALLCASGIAQAQAPLAEPAPMHGYIEPCTVEIVQDNSNQCEACKPTHDKPDLCERTLGVRGYTRKCRTGGHTAPGEVWCISKQRKRELERAAEPSLMPVIAAVSASALFGVFLLFKQRRRSKK